MAPPHGMGAHKGEAIGSRECVHRRVACGGGGGWAAAVCWCVCGCIPYPMIYVYVWACGISMWQSQAGGHQLTQTVAWVVYGLLIQQRKATAGRRWT
jgi:hypothetical protein